MHVIDSHTAGEPTRVILEGAPPLGNGPLSERLRRFRDEFDDFRSACVLEPRGSDVMVGALLCEPHDSSCAAGVIFFNNVGYLGMCGHGTIGLVKTLKYLDRIDVGACSIDTPVGKVETVLHENGEVSVQNVTSFRTEKGVTVDVPEVGTVTGDIAWGGNWFFLTSEPTRPLHPGNVDALQRDASRIRSAINDAGFTKVDHVELFGTPAAPDSDSRNFVLCPGLQYDRSPCGTGLSAKLACLAAEGVLQPEDPWVQEGILGTRFQGRFQWIDQSEGRIQPTITGRAYITAQSTLLFDDQDPFCFGIR